MSPFGQTFIKPEALLSQSSFLQSLVSWFTIHEMNFLTFWCSFLFACKSKLFLHFSAVLLSVLENIKPIGFDEQNLLFDLLADY